MGRVLWASEPEGMRLDMGKSVHIDQDGLSANEDQLEIECSSLAYID